MSIIDDIQSGNEAEFTKLYEQSHKKLYCYFKKKSGSAECSKELVQLTLIKVWRFRHTLSDNCSLDSQLFNIARTTFIDYLRQQAAYRQKMLRYADLNEEVINTLPSAALSNFEATDYLHVTTQRLSHMRRHVFILSRWQGLSNKEIAEALSISIKTVEDHLTKAIRYLRSISSL